MNNLGQFPVGTTYKPKNSALMLTLNPLGSSGMLNKDSKPWLMSSGAEPMGRFVSLSKGMECLMNFFNVDCQDAEIEVPTMPAWLEK